ncbi:MAG: flagellar basal-body rod protein FlgG [Planctomycetaceae bacterium]|nr:flagellar basal-body rod protein FlgG [Planctomycetaceae bacterium]
MLRALYSSATGMKAQEYVIDVTANNLANVNTNGFRRSMVDFADLMYVTGKQAGTDNTAGQQTPIPFQIGSGVRAVGTTKSFRSGTFEQTANPFDTAIEGDGFYKINLPNGDPRYTRDGSFKLNSQGLLVNSDGYQVEGAVSIPPDMKASEINIGVDGTVSGTLPGATTPQTFGTIPLFRFVNPAGLSSEGGNLFAETAASGTATQGVANQNGFGSLRQGFVERSNVEVVTELISLISAQRAYEINSRAVRAGDEMLSVTADIVR